MHQGRSVSDRGEHPELRGAERGACRERDGSRPDILAAVADVLAVVPARQVDRADDVLGEHQVERLFEWPALGGERRDVLEDGARRFGRGQHLTAPESWRGPTPGWPASRATRCRRSGTPETRRGSAGGP